MNIGASVLRMFWFMLGDNTFMRAVRLYLEDKYGIYKIEFFF